MGRIVYLIAGGGYTKLGSSSSIEQRLGTLQVASPHRLRIVATAPGGSALERRLLWVMSRRYRRALGEWFHGELTPEEAHEVFMQASTARPEAVCAADAYELYGQPSCECHGEPMYWSRDPRRRLGGRFRCAVAIRG